MTESHTRAVWHDPICGPAFNFIADSLLAKFYMGRFHRGRREIQMINKVFIFREGSYAGRVAILYESGRMRQCDYEKMPASAWAFLENANGENWRHPEYGTYTCYSRLRRESLIELLAGYGDKMF